MTQRDSDAPLAAVRDAALERALVDGSDARRHFALAGALDRVESREGGGNTPEARTPAAPGDGAAAGRSATGSETRSGSYGAAMLSALLTCTIATAALDDAARIDAHAPPNPWSPGDPRADLVAAGAVAAYRRFDVDVETVAARAGLSRADLRERVRKETESE